MKPIFTKLSSYKGASWLSSVMSGSIPIFIRPSQIGSKWKSDPSRSSTKKNSTSKMKYEDTLPKAMPLVQRWPSSTKYPHGSGTPVQGFQQSPPPRYMESKPTHLMFAPPTYDPMGNPPPLKTPKPPVPPKSRYYSPTKRWELVEEGDIERGESEETDRQRLVRSDGRW